MMHVACMMWPITLEPICAGTNKREVTREAVRLLRQEYGCGPVNRPAAMCSAPITSTDIEIISVPLVSNNGIAQKKIDKEKQMTTIELLTHSLENVVADAEAAGLDVDYAKEAIELGKKWEQGMSKRVIRGWICKGGKPKAEFGGLYGDDDEVRISNVWRVRGTKSEYHPDEWPPRRVTITIED